MVFAKIELGWRALHLGRYREARAYSEQALALNRENGYLLHDVLALDNLSQIALAEESFLEAQKLLQKSLTILKKRGQGGTLLGEALALSGYTAWHLGDAIQARQFFVETLQLATTSSTPSALANSLLGVALILADQGEKERAIELYAVASQNPLVANSRWFEDVAGRQIAAVAATLPPEVVAAAQERGRARDMWETARELLAELEQ